LRCSGIGIANAGANAPPALDVSGLPVFTLNCKAAPLAGQTFVVTDFYDQRFKIGFTEQQKQDLVNFLNAL
jgi:hypothetical protein